MGSLCRPKGTKTIHWLFWKMDDCLQDCNCVAYSCGAANYTGGSNEMCLMWSNELTDLQEEYHGGLTIFVRSTLSDIELTSEDCKPCGTYTIPYPLGTSADCGDPSYFNFHCNEETWHIVKFGLILLAKWQETVKEGAFVEKNFIGMDIM
ncbi:hypothetical protein SOVF_177320 [Spinacia oleracea]|nr:hypothetical protein SOVF_177320 [Spinacia oleracea]